MKQATRIKLKIAYEQCVEEDRSLEYTIEFMKDTVDVDHWCVMNYLQEQESEQEPKSQR